MGVSISRPPRCERGALPAELIAPEGTHKLAGSGKIDAGDTHPLAVTMAGRATGARGVEGHESRHLAVHRRVAGAGHFPGVVVGFDLHAVTDPQNPVGTERS